MAYVSTGAMTAKFPTCKYVGMSGRVMMGGGSHVSNAFPPPILCRSRAYPDQIITVPVCSNIASVNPDGVVDREPVDQKHPLYRVIFTSIES